MSDAAPAAGAQPEGADTGVDGQGQVGASDNPNGLYPDLSGVPEGVRDQVLSLLKEHDGAITRKFQEAAEFRKQWEPYSELGLNDIDPSELSDLLAFREIASDPEQFAEWYQAIGEQMGLGGGEDELGVDGDDDDGMSPERFEEMLGRALDQRLGPIEQTFEAQQQQQALSQAESYINSQLDELQEQHGEFDREAVCQLALAYEGQEAVQQGFADYQRLIGAAEKGFIDKKLQAPPTAEQGGRPGTQAQPITQFSEASQQAREMLRRSRM